MTRQPPYCIPPRSSDGKIKRSNYSFAQSASCKKESSNFSNQFFSKNRRGNRIKNYFLANIFFENVDTKLFVSRVAKVEITPSPPLREKGSQNRTCRDRRVNKIRGKKIKRQILLSFFSFSPPSFPEFKFKAFEKVFRLG